jgi:hypothetical protein
MSHIHFIGGEKGGVGKSVVARVLAQRFVDRNVPFAALDADRSSGALVRYYGDFTQAVDLGALESADQIMDRALGADRRVLVDLPAQSAERLWQWFAGANVLDFARDMGVRITLWHVSDGGYASISAIERAVPLFRDRVQHVLVRNHGRARDFSQLDASPARAQLNELGAKTFELPELEPNAMFAIDRFGASFWAASHRGDGESALKPLDRQRVRLWLERCNRELDAFGDDL